jgi:hypothetical protein
MTDPIVKSRATGAVHPEHLGEATRALGRDGQRASLARLEDALWAARALPTALDALADVGAGGLGRARLSLLAVHLSPGPGAGLLLAVAVLEPPGAEVRFFDEQRRVRARVRFVLDEDPTLDDVPVIRRFVHGPRGA